MIGAIGAGIGLAGSTYGKLWGRKRPKPPKELMEIANRLYDLGKNLPQSPEALSVIANQLQRGAALYDLPPAELRRIASGFDGRYVDSANAAFGRQRGFADDASSWLAQSGSSFADSAAAAGDAAYADAAASRDLYADEFRGAEVQAARDAMHAGTPWEQARRSRIAADRQKSALADAQAQSLNSARLRGVAPTAGAVLDPTRTAAGADMIARAAYDAGENERRLGFQMRAGLLPYADSLSRRGIVMDQMGSGFHNSALAMREGGVAAGNRLQNQVTAGHHGAAQLGGAGQALHSTAWDAGNRRNILRENALGRGFDAHLGAHNSDLNTAQTRAGLYGNAFDAFRGGHSEKTNYWKGRTGDVASGIGAVGAAIAGGLGGGFGGNVGIGGGGFGSFLSSLPIGGAGGGGRVGNALLNAPMARPNMTGYTPPPSGGLLKGFFN